MSLNYRNHSPPVSPSQLSLADYVRESVQNSTTVTLDSGIVFHPAESHVGANDFSIKLRYRSQSFHLHGTYSKTAIRTYSDSEAVPRITIDGVRITDLLSYRAGRYQKEASPERLYRALQSAVKSFLSNPEYNPILQPPEPEAPVYH